MVTRRTIYLKRQVVVAATYNEMINKRLSSIKLHYDKILRENNGDMSLRKKVSDVKILTVKEGHV